MKNIELDMVAGTPPWDEDKTTYIEPTKTLKGQV